MFAKLTSFFILFVLSFAAVASPDIESWHERGAKVLYVYAPELPMVDINVVFNAGAARDGSLPGVAQMTNAMLDEGTADRDADQIATAFANVGAKYSASAERDMAVLSLRTLTEAKAMETALDTFSTLIAQPSFPEKGFNRLQQQLLRGLEAEKQSPTAQAARQFYHHLFDKHPYANMPSGEIDSVKNIEIADLKKFYRQYYVTNNAVVAIVGAVDKKQAKQIAAQLLANLKEGDKAEPLPTVSPLASSETVAIDHPSTQTTILMGQTGMSRHDPDYLALYVGNHILGGSGLVSMLSDEVREKRGLTYGVYSYFRPMMQQGPYIFSLQTRNDQKDQALTVMRDTLRGFVDNGPTEQQVIAAKQNITGGFALHIDSNSEIVGYLAMIGFYELPLDYLDTFNDRVNQITVADIQDAFKRRVHPDKMLTVLVGGEN